jgi:hypothetical protein
MSEVEVSQQHKIPLLVLFGILSVISAEVFSSSSPLWMYDLWGLLVVLPLYWGHGLLLLNAALYFKRSSITHLYLFGIIYGLYESWMTKVIWAGYMGQSPQFGQFLGFAIGEFMIIALFWHAFFSFIVPVIAFHLLGNPDASFAITRRRLGVYLFVIATSSVFIGTKFPGNYPALILVLGSNSLVLALAYALARRTNPGGFSLESLRLGRTGLVIAGGYTAFLYVFMFTMVFPDRIAPPITLLLTVLFYLFIIMLLYVSEEKAIGFDAIGTQVAFRRKHVVWGFGAIVLLSFVTSLLSQLAGVAGVFLYLGMMLSGPVLLVIAVYRVVTRKL